MEGKIAIKSYTTEEVRRMSNDDFNNIAACYQEIFNFHWNENWTLEASLTEVRKSLTVTHNRSPLLSILWDEDKVVGFAWIILTEVDYISEEDMPFNLGKQDKMQGIKVVKYWCNLVKRRKIVIYRELGLIKDYRQHRGNHMSPRLVLPIIRRAYSAGYKNLFYWTSPDNITYKLGLGFNWHPIHYFIDDNRVILKGGIKKFIYYLEGMINKDRKILEEMMKNRREIYLCN